MALVAEYRYVNAQGSLLFVVERYRPKRFRIIRPDGRQVDSPPAKVLYRLPELRRAAKSETVYVVEGEKDVESLRLHGLVSTTNPGGTHAGWDDAYSRELRGRHVAILPDCDNPGRQHAEIVRNALRSEAASVVIASLPGLRPPQDISDWLQCPGASVQSLRALVEMARYRAVQLRSPPKGGNAKRSLIVTADLPPSMKLVLLAVFHYQPDQTASVPASQLAAATGLHRVTVQRMLGALRSRGVITRLAPSSWKIQWDILAAVQPAKPGRAEQPA